MTDPAGSISKDPAAPIPAASGRSAMGQPASRAAATAAPLTNTQPLPTPTGQPPYRLDLADVLDQTDMDAIKQSGRVTFHLLGDVGGVKAPQDQQIVAMKMADDARRPDEPGRFAYIMGDVVYYNGDSSEYYPQFYEPYADYPQVILSVPGNHDGTPSLGTTSLDAWMTNFATAQPVHSPDARDVPRLTVTQPNCYWTLTSPYVTLIGLYTNTPDTGYIDPDQAAWFANELRDAPSDRPLIVAAHHPALSLDRYHGGSEPMITIIDTAIEASGRVPELIAAGHVHDYQHWVRTINNHDVPFIVAGAGGYWHLHEVVDPNRQPPTLPYQVPEANARLLSYVDDRHGFLRVTATSADLTLEYLTVPRAQESWHATAQTFETFTIPRH